MNIIVKCVKDLSVNRKNIKLEENRGKKSFWHWLGKHFLDKTQKEVNLKQKIKTFEFTELKTSAFWKTPLKNVLANHKLGYYVYNTYADTKDPYPEHIYKF